MGFNGMNHKHNWPSSVFSSKETDVLEPIIRNDWDTEGRSAFTPSVSGHDMSSNHLTQSIVNPIWESTNKADYGTHVRETDSKLMDDFVNLEELQNFQRAPSSSYPVTCTSPNPRLTETSNSKVGPYQIYKTDKYSDKLTVKQLHDGSLPSYHFEDPMLLLNGFSTGNNISVKTQTTSQGRQMKTSSAKSLKNSSKPRFNISEGVGPVKASDGSFLTLGIGKDAVSNPVRHFSNEEIAGKLQDNFHPRMKRAHIQHSASSFPTPTYNPGSDMPTIQSNSNMWSGTSDYSGGCIAHNNDRIFSAGQTGLRTTPSHGVATSQANTRLYSGANSYGNIGHTSNSSGAVAGIFPYAGNQGSQAAHPLSYNEPFSYIPQSESTGFSKVGPTSSSPVQFATQPRLNHYRNPPTHLAINTSSKAPNCFPFPPLGGISNKQNFEGQVAPGHKVEPTQASKNAITGRMQFQALPSDSVALLPDSVAYEPSVSVAQAALKGGVPHTQDSSHAWSHADLCIPSVALGPLEARKPAQSPQKFVMSDNRTVAKKTVVPPVIPSSRQRRKISPQLVGQPSRLHMHQLVPSSSSSHVPSTSANLRPVRPPASGSRHLPPPAVVYIKREGNEGHLQPIGHNCLLCKRDLSFYPEGPVTRPSTPPVAILPCGHVFHEDCLQNITPEDQHNDPPCIPCAIGEF